VANAVFGLKAQYNIAQWQRAEGATPWDYDEKNNLRPARAT